MSKESMHLVVRARPGARARAVGGGGGGGGAGSEGVALDATPQWVIAGTDQTVALSVVVTGDLTGTADWSARFIPQSGTARDIALVGTDALTRTLPIAAADGVGTYAVSFTLSSTRVWNAYVNVTAYPVSTRKEVSGKLDRLTVQHPDPQAAPAASYSVLVHPEGAPGMLGMAADGDEIDAAMLALLERAYFDQRRVTIDYLQYTGQQTGVIVGVRFEPQ